MSQKSIVVGDGLVEKQAVVDYLQVTVRTVKTWTKRRKIPSIRIGAKVIRYRLADIGKALRKHCFVAAELVPKKAAK